MGGFKELQPDNTHLGEIENRREEEAPKPTQLVKAVLTHPFSILTGLPEAPYSKLFSVQSFYIVTIRNSRIFLQS